jgi:dipeptidyl aminopeptidase/acylaminoacyl peptidase
MKKGASTFILNRLIQWGLTALLATMAGCAGMPAPSSGTAPALIPVRDLVADWDGSGAYQISPNGQRLMWVARLGLGPGLFVKDLQTGVVNSYKIPGGGMWARDSRHVLIHQSNNGNENTHVWAIDTDKPNQVARDLTPFSGARSYILRTLPQSNDLIIARNRRDPKFDDVYRYDMDSGELKLLATNPGQVGPWLVSDDGEVMGRARLEGETWVFETPGETAQQPWTNRFRVSYFDTVTPIGTSSTPGHWWALSNRGRDKLALVEINLHDGSERVEHADAKVDVSGWLWSRIKHAPLAVATEPDTQQWLAFDAALQQALQKLKGSNDARITLNNQSDDERWMSATVTRHNGGEHVLYDLQTQSFQVLAQLSRSRVNATTPLPAQQPVTLKSRDGLDLHGYLSLPLGVTKPYPTVVYVHGGPWARDVHLNGDPMLPFLTNRGYAVLQVNYRGSSGYGKAFVQAAQGEFAGKMHSDLTDAVDALIAQGVVDPQRVAISGASYGGYASLVGMTHTPGKFRCAISTVGMSDLTALIENAPPYWELNKPHWIHYVGDPTDPAQRTTMQERSPLYKAERVLGPILLMHGVHDPRVKVSQSVQMAEALRAQGKTVELQLFGKAGHGFQRWQDNLVAYRKTEDFLANCLGGRTGGFDFFELGARLF